MSGTDLTPRVAALETQVADLQHRVASLEGRVTALEGGPPPDPNAESKDGTTIHPGSGTIVDAKGNKWTVDANKVLCINGYQDGFTPPVLIAYYKAHTLYFERENGAWFQATGTQPAWLACADPTGGVTPPNPNPPSGGVGDQTGTTALRCTDMFDFFGANLFPNGQDGAGAAADAAHHITGIKRLWGTSGFVPLMRIYAQNNVGSAPVIAFCKAVVAGIPNCRFSICATDPASADVVVQILRAADTSGKWVMCVEGINEPNNTQNLGGVPTSPTDCLAAQQKIYAAAHPLGVAVLTPSVADLTGDPNFIQNYYGSADILKGIIAASDIANVHNYPNNGAVNRQFEARTQGIVNVYGGVMQPGTSEFHPLLFNNTGDETRGAHYTTVAKLSGLVDWGQHMLTWYCFYDYKGFSKPVGLFHGFDPTSLRPEAQLMATLMKVCADNGATSRSFVPGKLDVTFSGMPVGFNSHSGGRFCVLQRSSDKAFLIPVWNEQDAQSTASTQVTARFNAGAKSRVLRYSFGNPITATPSVQTLSNTDTITFALKQLDLQVLEVHM